jgi:hypothetical protein
MRLLMLKTSIKHFASTHSAHAHSILRCSERVARGKLETAELEDTCDPVAVHTQAFFHFKSLLKIYFEPTPR